MQKLKLCSVVLLIALFQLSCARFHVHESAIERGKVEHAVQEWIQMWNTYDLLQVNKLFLDDNSLSYFSSEKEGVIKGMKNVLEHHVGFGFVEGGKETETKLWLEQVQIDEIGGGAVVTGIWYFRKMNQGLEEIQRGPVTIVYVQVEGRPLIAHMNFGNYENEY